MYRILIGIFSVFLILHSVNASEGISIKVNDSLENEVLEYSQGTKQNLLLSIENNNDAEKNIIIKNKIEDDNGLSVKFFSTEIDSVYEELLKQNDYNIAELCDKKDIDVNLKEWCNGSNEFELSIPANESMKIRTVLVVDDNALDGVETIFITDESGEIISQLEMSYRVPDKGIIKASLENFVLIKKEEHVGLVDYFKSDFNPNYKIATTIKNSGTEVVDYKFCTVVTSLWIDEKVEFCNSDKINSGKTKIQKQDITVPRMGKVSIGGGIEFTDNDGEIRQENSDLIEMLIFPRYIVGGIMLGICFCLIFVLLYKYINKNMFGFKKKNKKQNKTFTGKYIVKDADNMISIAQSYNVPWKELAEINNVKPPYVLISGETIMVPGESESKNVATDDEDVINVEKKENENKGKDVEYSVISNQENSQNDVITEINSAHKGDLTNVNEVNEDEEVIKKVQQDVPQQTKRKVTYAAPENMLAKPASEPTTRAIDIEWMQDDEAVYAEEMQMQEKKMNMKLIFITIVVVCFIALIIWWIVGVLSKNTNNEEVSLDNLIEENINTGSDEEKIGENDADSAEGDSGNAIDNAETNDNAIDNDEKDKVEKGNSDVGDDVSEINIQVLNAGSVAGVAGTVTNDFKELGYKTNPATNSDNDYKDVVIYYATAKQQYLEGVSNVVSEKYGDKKIEESDDVAKKYDADFVIVLGE